MSDDGDGDELGGLEPKASLPRAKKPNVVRTTQSKNRTDTELKARGVRRNAPIPVSDNSETEAVDRFDFTGLDDDDDVGHPETKTKPAQRLQATHSKTNGKQKTKGKSKSKDSQLKPPSPKQALVQSTEVSDDDVHDEQVAIAHDRSAKRHPQRLSPNDVRSARDDDVSKVVEQLRRAEDQVKSLSKQLEEVFQIRETEPEQLLKQQETQHRQQLQVQETLIRELTSQISMMKIPMMQTENTTVLDLLTREAANEEKRELELQMGRWRKLIEESERSVKERDQRIAALEQREKELKYELNAEIERSAALAAKANRNPPAGLRGGRLGGVDDPRHTEVLRFYEDVTNLLVPHMKTQPGQYLGMEDWVLSCIYTFNDDTADDLVNAPRKSLQFTLRFCYEPPEEQESEPIISKDQLISTVHFTPLELDKEPPDFVEKLDFLKAPFSFARNQLPLFLRTIYQRMSEAVLDEDEDHDMDED